MNEQPDSDLVVEARDGSHVAFAELVDRYHVRVSRVVAARMGGAGLDGEDVVQQAFTAAWVELPTLLAPQKFASWVNGIAANLARRWVRDQARYRELLDAHGRPDGVLRDERRGGGSWDRVRDSVAELPPEQAEAVTLHYLHGLSYAEIAEELSVPVSTVLGRLQRARRKLREEHAPMTSELRIEVTTELHAFLQDYATSRGVDVGEFVTHVLEKYEDGVTADAAQIKTRDVVREVPPLPDMNAEGAREVVRRFFQALVDRDYATANDLTETAYSDTRWEDTWYAGITEIVEIGEPFQEEDRRYAGGQGVFVPYEVRRADSPRKPWRVAMRRDNPDGRWVFDGGL
ncbi:MAG: RNA polymerase sigma factor [Candidatus Poribacteria bacterium]